MSIGAQCVEKSLQINVLINIIWFLNTKEIRKGLNINVMFVRKLSTSIVVILLMEIINV